MSCSVALLKSGCGRPSSPIVCTLPIFALPSFASSEIHERPLPLLIGPVFCVEIECGRAVEAQFGEAGLGVFPGHHNPLRQERREGRGPPPPSALGSAATQNHASSPDALCRLSSSTSERKGGRNGARSRNRTADLT